MGDGSSYRYEFRTFSPDLAEVLGPMVSAMEETGFSEERNLYLLAIADEALNLKIRSGCLERKTCIEVTGSGLQKWRPDAPRKFPLDPSACNDLFGLNSDRPLGMHDVLDEICRPSGRGICMHLLKRRRHFEQGDVIGEYCELVVNGARIESIAIESTDADSLSDCRESLGLAGVENTSYVKALNRVAGLEPLPRTSRWRFDAGGREGAS